MKESTKRAIRTFVQTVIAGALVVPAVIVFLPKFEGQTAAVVGTVVAVAAGISKIWAVLEEAGIIPPWLRVTPEQIEEAQHEAYQEGKATAAQPTMTSSPPSGFVSRPADERSAGVPTGRAWLSPAWPDREPAIGEPGSIVVPPGAVAPVIAPSPAGEQQERRGRHAAPTGAFPPVTGEPAVGRVPTTEERPGSSGRRPSVEAP